MCRYYRACVNHPKPCCVCVIYRIFVLGAHQPFTGNQIVFVHAFKAAAESQPTVFGTAAGWSQNMHNLTWHVVCLMFIQKLNVFKVVSYNGFPFLTNNICSSYIACMHCNLCTFLWHMLNRKKLLQSRRLVINLVFVIIEIAYHYSMSWTRFVLMNWRLKWHKLMTTMTNWFIFRIVCKHNLYILNIISI